VARGGFGRLKADPVLACLHGDVRCTAMPQKVNLAR